MDAGLAAIAGAVVGGAVTMSNTMLSNRLATKKAAGLADKRKARLRGLLSSDKFTWRSIDLLSSAIGADRDTTCELLIDIDARASLENSDRWALVSRAPWPQDVEPRA